MKFIDDLKKKIYLRISKNRLPKSKLIIQNGVSAKFSAADEAKKKKVEEKTDRLVKKFFYEPEKLLNNMRSGGLKVYKIKNSAVLFAKLNEREGLILPQKGLKALILSMVLEKKPAFSTPPVFVFEAGETEIYTIIEALYRYFAYKSKMPGYDFKSQKLFKKFYLNRNTNIEKNMSINEICACKEALARDIEAVNYTLKISKEYQGAKNALNKIKSDNSAML